MLTCFTFQSSGPWFNKYVRQQTFSLHRFDLSTGRVIADLSAVLRLVCVFSLPGFGLHVLTTQRYIWYHCRLNNAGMDTRRGGLQFGREWWRRMCQLPYTVADMVGNNSVYNFSVGGNGNHLPNVITTRTTSQGPNRSVD